MNFDKNHNKEEILKEIEDLAKPIDFEDLIKKGILEKKGNRYKIKLINDLPAHVRKKIISMDSNGYVKFSNPSKAQKLLDKYEK